MMITSKYIIIICTTSYHLLCQNIACPFPCGEEHIVMEAILDTFEARLYHCAKINFTKNEEEHTSLDVIYLVSKVQGLGLILPKNFTLCYVIKSSCIHDNVTDLSVRQVVQNVVLFFVGIAIVIDESIYYIIGNNPRYSGIVEITVYL